MSLFDRLKKLAAKLFKSITSALWAVLEFPLGLFLERVPLTTIAFFIKDHARGIWDFILGIPFIRKTLSKAVFRKFGGIAPPRPHQTTMAQDYTSWYGMVDRRYTGRHLPVDKGYDERTRPEKEEVVELFLRPDDGTPGGTKTDDIRSTLLFASFAQWFTDSFLRTSHSFKFVENCNVDTDSKGVPKREEGREKYNDSTHEIDLCQIYGLNAGMTAKLRSPTEKGCLRSQQLGDGEYPEFLLKSAPTGEDGCLPIKDHFIGLHQEPILRFIFRRAQSEERYTTLFATGLEHSNATLGNALLNVIFLREHNRIAREMSQAYPDWDSDRVFETARNTMIVLLLNIVISDYIKHISPLSLPLEFQPGMAEQETWYRSNRIHIEFNILYRWHGLVPSQFSFLPDPQKSEDFRHNNQWLLDTGVAAAVSHFSEERAGKIIIGNTPRFLAAVKQDTVKLMRAAKLRPYNDYRERFGLSRAKEFTDITNDPTAAATLERMYGGKIEDVEWYVGMCAESHGRGMLMGELMFNMVAHDAFTHALTNPLLSNEVFREETFGDVGWKIIEETSKLDQIVQRVIAPGESTVCHFALNDEHRDK